MKIPDKGLRKDDVFKALKSFKGADLDWKSGRVLGYVYYPGDKAQDVINEAYTMYLTENALDPTSFPSTLRLENEVVGMVANLLRGDENVVGNFTSGGTESLILAVKTARDFARATRPHIKEPEMVLPVTAHASFYKAAHYLNIKPVITPVHDGSFLADVDAMRAAITDNTILLVGSAPGYAHGVADPIADIAGLALEKDLLCHVDGCVGGIHLSYMRKLGFDVPEFDFTVPGVTSISADLHKYGYTAKGASVILYKDKELRKHQIFACSRWTGYTIINAAVTSAKTAGPMAAAWAVMNRMEGLQVLGEPNMCMFAFASTTDKINVYHLADVMKNKGWYLQPQFKRANSPANLHISMSRSTVHQAEAFLKDFEETIEELKRAEISEEARDLQAEIDKLSIKFDDETFFKLASMAGITGTELPDKMETINQIMEVLPYDVSNQIMEVLPYDVSEWILIEFLNNLMVQPAD
jgi:glutamate/tyrosine decarboxylase-like PLP-dependent enzyme